MTSLVVSAPAIPALTIGNDRAGFAAARELWSGFTGDEKSLFRCLIDRHHGRVREPTLHRNGVVLDDDFLGVADHPDTVLVLRFFGHHRRRGENADTGLPESLHQRRVVKLPDDARLDAVFAELAFQRSAYRRAGPWDQQGCAGQGVRKIRPIAHRQLRHRMEDDRAASQRVAVAFYAQFGG